jgi:hypothetical protein
MRRQEAGKSSAEYGVKSAEWSGSVQFSVFRFQPDGNHRKDARSAKGPSRDPTSEFCTLHSAFRTFQWLFALVREEAGAHRGGAPGIGFLVRASDFAHHELMQNAKCRVQNVGSRQLAGGRSRNTDYHLSTLIRNSPD